MTTTTIEKKLECGVHSLPEWMQEMLAERMDRFMKAELEDEEETKTAEGKNQKELIQACAK